tara:strand:+ start:698 stop:1360 length:663 start_codon:yes stop_codon:yes gene_type:complete
MKPRIIHQVFFEVGTKKLEDYPLFVENREKWKLWCERNNYEYMFHTLEDLEPIMKQEDKDLFKRIDDENRFGFCKIDYGRLIILSHYGGVYCDMDVAPKLDNEFHELVNKYEPFVVRCKFETFKQKIHYNNWILGCEKGGFQDLMKYNREQYDIKSKIAIYDSWKVRFFFQTCSIPAVNRFFKLQEKKGFIKMTDEDALNINDYVINGRSKSWINGAKGI